MRVLLLLRGSAACGKSTWIEQNGLKPYALSADDIRLLCQSPTMQSDGSVTISQSNDSVVWKTLFRLLEVRMSKGEFTVIDATNSKTSEMNRYKELCDTYRYRMYCVDFTDIPIDEVKRRNANREPLKQVPEEVIDNMYSRFATQKIPSGIKVIKPDELDTVWMKTYDLSEYKKIHHIGDIHGCNTVLQEYISGNGGLKDDEFYIFTGDYIDRGLENADVVNYIMSISLKPNVLLLEGNHERWLWRYGRDERSTSKEFELITKPQLETAGLDKKEVRKFYRRLSQCAYYSYKGNVYLVTHAGLSMIPENLTLVATDQMIRGVGSYDEVEKVAETFVSMMPENVYQVHGHRNTKQLPIQVNERVFNLEGRVEFGGCLRCLVLDEQGCHPVEVKNKVFKTPETLAEESVVDSPVADAILNMRASKLVSEKCFGNISSFNFTNKAFYDKAWNQVTTKARGLFIDTVKGKVVARSYNKFFNINERPETQFGSLQDQLKFPVTVYVKENGYLGIVSYNEYEDELFIASKSAIEGDHAQWLREMLYDKVSVDDLGKMKNYIKEHNVSFVFECVDMKHDPHVIEYPESELFLLDVVRNDMDFSKYEYDQMVDVANQFGLTPKEKAYEITTWQEFFDWYHEVLEPDYTYNGRIIEGFVIEDSNNYMIKVKLSYYNFWKFMRSIAGETLKKGYITKTSALTTPEANEFYGWMKNLHDTTEDLESVSRNICVLRNMFYASKKQ